MKELGELEDKYGEKLEGTNAPNLRQKKYIGKGRSAKVYLSFSGTIGIATKTFTGESISKIILFILTGSANPYTWCEDAIKTAIIRRRLLSNLCEFWFKDKLRLPNTYNYRWNEIHKAFEIDTEYIAGRHAPLFNPLNKNADNYMSELKKTIMKPLQGYLIQSGFDGLVWQSGKGNPVAVSNFMMHQNDDNSRQWIWIDLESGLPALFAINPFSTLFYYLPKCIKHRGWLFDNVDINKLNAFLCKNKHSLTTNLGIYAYQQLCSDSDLLSKTQEKWKELTRHQRSLYYAASQNKITEELKIYYENKPVVWFFKSIVILLKSLIAGLQRVVKDFSFALYNFRYKKFFKRIYFYSTSARYRWGTIRWYLSKEIDKWRSRKFFTETESKFLKNELKKDDVSSYLTDFSIHLGIKPFVKFFTFVVVPILIGVGFLNIQTGGIILVGAGPLTRTLYTIWRMTHSLVKSKPNIPLVAFLIGTIPVVGNLAYPAELLYRSRNGKGMLAKFIIYSFSAKIGAKIPIWGGTDSEIEHFFTKMCHLALK